MLVSTVSYSNPCTALLASLPDAIHVNLELSRVKELSLQCYLSPTHGLTFPCSA